jgi:hypothetical protein
MNYPAASQGVSKARQPREDIVGASSVVWIRGAIKSVNKAIRQILSDVSCGEEKKGDLAGVRVLNSAS